MFWLLVNALGLVCAVGLLLAVESERSKMRARVKALEDALRECAADAEVMDMPGGEWCIGIDGDKWGALVALLEPTP